MFASKRLGWAMALIATVAVGACGDDPVAVEEHGEPAGVELVLNGAVIASYDGTTMTWTGEMEVEVGMETAHIDVRFVDEDGDPIDFDSEPDFYLEVMVEDETIAEFEQDTPGEFGGHLHGEAVGETDVTFSLMHGSVGTGHADFTTMAVHAHVEAAPLLTSN